MRETLDRGMGIGWRVAVTRGACGWRLVVVEGSFTASMGPSRGNVPVHQAFGVFSRDRSGETFIFRTYTAQGANGEEGHWREVGHASRDGETWHQFFEMELSRRAPTAPRP